MINDQLCDEVILIRKNKVKFVDNFSQEQVWQNQEKTFEEGLIEEAISENDQIIRKLKETSWIWENNIKDQLKI